LIMIESSRIIRRAHNNEDMRIDLNA